MKYFDIADISERESFFSLEEIFSTIEALTGMEVSMYSAEGEGMGFYRSLEKIPFQYRKHMSDFCRVVKANKTGRGCAGHDAQRMVKRAIETGEPFVNICHGGVAEVILPVYGVRKKPMATVHIGQAVTEDIEDEGFSYVLNRVGRLGVDEKKLRAAFEKLPRMKSSELLNIGKLADLALKGFIASAGPELFEYEIRLSRYPAIRRALEIIQSSDSFEKIDQTWIAGKVYLNPSYFCRLFKEALGCTFSDFLIKKKVQKASSLLHITDMSIMEIAIRCGYSRQSYFTSMFKRYTGMTPSRYRNNKKKSK